MSRFEQGDFTFNVGVSLDEFEAIWDLYNAAAVQYTPANLRALASRWEAATKPQRDGKPVKVGSLDPNLLLALVLDWIKGVRDVPLPLPLASSAGEQSEETPPSSSSEPSSGTPSSDDGPDTPLRA